MKITGVEANIFSYKYNIDETWKWSGGQCIGRNLVLVKVKTDEGIEGYGEVGEEAFLPQSVKKIVEEQFSLMLIGEDPFNIEKIWHKMYMRSNHWGRKGLIIPIISGIDIALWDLVAKYLKQPLYKILGGACRDKIRVYASTGQEKPIKEIVEQVLMYKDMGFTAIKVRIGSHSDLDHDVELISEIRKAIGTKIDLMADAGQSYNDNPWTDFTAINVAKKLERFDLFWLEEPLHPDNITGYKRLCNSTIIPIALGENEYTRFGFQQLIDQRAGDIFQPDVTRAGGFSECKKIAAMASAYQLPCAPHNFLNGISLMASLHFIASTANCIIMEYDCTANPLREILLKEPIILEEGYIELPKSPGLGVEVKEDLEKRFPFKGEVTVNRDIQNKYKITSWLDI